MLVGDRAIASDVCHVVHVPVKMCHKEALDVCCYLGNRIGKKVLKYKVLDYAVFIDEEDTIG